MQLRWMITWALVLVTACSADKPNPNPDPDMGADVQTPDDAAQESDDGAGADVPDAPASDCVQVTIDDVFVAEYVDDVGAEYRVGVGPAIDGYAPRLALLFERYNESEYVGTFELGVGPDGNFGTCTHCLYIPGDSPERAYFADRGTLVSRTNPYDRRLDLEVRDLRLVEVAVDQFTRESAPLADGGCVEVADFAHAGSFPVSGWLCPDEQYNDGAACHCGCGAYDPDCGGAIECLPDDPACTPRDKLPVVGCTDSQVCAFEPISQGTACTEACDWLGRTGCTGGTCVFEFGVGDGDLCLDDERVASDVALGEPCPASFLQLMCNVVDGFAEGFCGPDSICRPICQSNDECTVDGESCWIFSPLSPLGYCGPPVTDG